MAYRVAPSFFASIALCAVFQGCSSIAVLRTAELRELQARVDTLGTRLFFANQQLYKEQKQQGELLRVVRADMQVRFGELSQRLSGVEGNVNESQARLSNIDRKTAEIQQRWDAQARADSVKESMVRAEEENLFKIAYSDFTSGRFDLALAGFRDFVARYPSSAQTPKAEYWQAECRYALKEYDSAQVAFAAYLKGQPEGEMVCATLYKLGLAYEKLGKEKHRTAVWEKLLSQCPQSEEARSAQSRMK